MAKKLSFCLWGFIMGVGLCYYVCNWPHQKKMWINPKTSYLIYTHNRPSGEYILMGRETE